MASAPCPPRMPPAGRACFRAWRARVGDQPCGTLRLVRRAVGFAPAMPVLAVLVAASERAPSPAAAEPSPAPAEPEPATDAGPSTASTIPTITVRNGPYAAPTIWRADVPSSRISTNSPAPAPTVSTAIR